VNVEARGIAVVEPVQHAAVARLVLLREGAGGNAGDHGQGDGHDEESRSAHGISL
jgi:hypothetical protein